MTAWTNGDAVTTPRGDVITSATLAGDVAYQIVFRADKYRPEIQTSYGWWDYGCRFATLPEAIADAEDHAANEMRVKALNRRVVADRALALRHTPWGVADGAIVYAPGVVFYQTPSHGGFGISPDLNRVMGLQYRNDDGWYEEDCEWCKVALALPYAFTPREVRAAWATYDKWYAHKARVTRRAG